jgi:DNA helicase II / ATP-dependent DNA helicase PcrA
MGATEVIVGPPGCGKTTEMTRRLVETVKTIPGDQLIVAAFTRAARGELQRKLAPTGACIDKLATLHSLAYRLLRLRRTQVMDDRRWQEFGAKTGRCFSRQSSAGGIHFNSRDDRCRAAYDFARNAGCSIEAAVAAQGSRGAVHIREVDLYVREYEEYKRLNVLYDYTDTLVRVVEEGLAFEEATQVWIDEAQDLSALQTEVVDLWRKKADRCVVAGDDDQAIYSFQGARPDWLVSLADRNRETTTILAQSHRVPQAAHAAAQDVIARNSRRIQKAYRPTPVQGSYRVLLDHEASAQIDGVRDTFWLTRTRSQFKRVSDLLTARGILHVVEDGGLKTPASYLFDVAVLEAAARGEAVGADELSEALSSVPAGSSALPRGVKAELEAEDGLVGPTRLEELVGKGTLLDDVRRDGALPAMTKLSTETTREVAALQQRHGAGVKPKVIVTTLHASKGREADLVVVGSELSKRVYHEYLRGDVESENRLYYVGFTRTMRDLIVAEPLVPRRTFAVPRAVTGERRAA